MTIRFEFEWLDDAPSGAAFGPEIDTWCRLAITIDGAIVTSNHPADFHSSDDRPYVVGPLSGIVEWVVEVWPYLLWEFHCPFSKTPILGARARIPTERDAGLLWSDLKTSHTIRNIAVWQHRHTLGHGSSDLALPSIVLLPEDKQLGVVLDHIPFSLDPTVRFTPTAETQWPSDPVWIVRENAISELSRVVDETIARVRSRPNSSWATFMDAKWKTAKSIASDPLKRRELALGNVVAQEWNLVEGRLKSDSAGIESLLFDSEILTSVQEFRSILDFALAAPSHPTKPLFDRPNRAGRPYEQGYILAQNVRTLLDNECDPIVELDSVLTRFGVQVQQISTTAFASACFARAMGGAVIALSVQHRKWGVAPSRFAIAAALGRFLSERVEGKPFGAAHSSQSRWISTQRANAFAAELLLPAKAIATGSDVAEFCDAYGISRSAAEWHVHNRHSRYGSN